MEDLETKGAENVGQNATETPKRKNDYMRMGTLKSRVYELARHALDAREDAEAAVEVPLEEFADGMALALRQAIIEVDAARRAAEEPAEPQGEPPTEQQAETPKGEPPTEQHAETQPTGDAQGGQDGGPPAEAREGAE